MVFVRSSEDGPIIGIVLVPVHRQHRTMRWMLAVILAGLFLFLLAGCGGSGGGEWEVPYDPGQGGFGWLGAARSGDLPRSFVEGAPRAEAVGTIAMHSPERRRP